MPDQSISAPAAESPTENEGERRRLSRTEDDSEQKNNSESVVPKVADFDLQLAMDAMNTGSTEEMRDYLCRVNGLDPADESIRIAKSSRDYSNYYLELTVLGVVHAIDVVDDEERAAMNEETRKVHQQLDEDVDTIKVRFEIFEEPLIYERLDPEKKQIRLLMYDNPDQRGKVSSLKLKVYSIDDLPPYYAISYVWGNPEKSCYVPVNNQKAMVTRSLYRAIAHAMMVQACVPIWIDGLCIDQDNLEERGSQVLFMGQIYSNAKQVMAFMGNNLFSDEEDTKEPDGQPVILPWNSDVDPDTCALIQKSISLMNSLYRNWTFAANHEGVRDEKDWTQLGIPRADDPDKTVQNTLILFLNNEWFRRAWIMQEAAVCKKTVLYFWGVPVHLDSLVDFWEQAQRKDPPEIFRRGPITDRYNQFLGLSQLKGLSRLRRRLYYQKPEEIVETKKLLNLLVSSRTNKASDWRDKVYALMNLASDYVSQNITPDYSDSSTVSHLYASVAADFISSGQITILHHAGIPVNIPDLPSWAPDWTTQVRSNLLTELYDVLPRTNPRFTLTKDVEGLSTSTRLTIRGVVLSQIAAHYIRWTYYGEEKSVIPSIDYEMPFLNDEEARQFIFSVSLGLVNRDRPSFQNVPQYMTKDTDIAIARTLCADVDWTATRIGNDANTAKNLEPIEPRETQFLESVRAFWQLYEPQPNPGEDADESVIAELEKTLQNKGFFGWIRRFSEEETLRLKKLAWSFEHAMTKAHKGRCLGITTNGELVAAPFDVQAKDRVVVFEGLSTPFVLRQTDDGKNTWRIVGDCYGHGLVDGEIVEKSESKLEALQPEQISLNQAGERYAVLLHALSPDREAEYGKFVDFAIV